VLNGTVGSLIAVFDAILVNGYGAKPAAGWTKPFTGTNKAAFRMGTGGSARRMYFRVDDSNAAHGWCRGFDDMTDVDTGTESFPTSGQVANGLRVWKSLTADSTARPWIAFATPFQFYFYAYVASTALTNVSASNSCGELFFGEYIYNGPSFTHNVAIQGQNSSINQSNGARLCAGNAMPMDGFYLCRSYTNAVGSVQGGRSIKWPVSAVFSSPNVNGLSHGMAPINTFDNKVYFSENLVLHPGHVLVGRLPGLWTPLTQGLLGNHLDPITGSGGLAGKSFLLLQGMGDIQSTNINLIGRLAFETTDWA
jgi:hypothetical protein